MGRKPRVDFEGACHHIVVKGINNSYIFDSDEAKNKYLFLLDKYREKHGIKLFAYCIMDNHAHLLIQSSRAKSNNHICISDFMHDVQCAFAKWYNKVYPHCGPVFNSRFNSFSCLSVPYFIYAINYIHKNPLKHGVTRTYNYRFSSFKDYASGKGLSDLEACYDFLGMSRKQLLLHLTNLKNTESFPFLDKLLEKIRKTQNNNTLELLLIELAFRIEDIRGTRLVKYFDKVQHDLMNEVISMKTMSVKALSNLLCVSPSYIYKKLNTS
ncbi:MAG: hypothetical protein CR995_00180 [Clostridiales bacterium]|nr:MAG: hypothetical protein CR995_00180 [Clostridiales bacterium]